jgi:hemoglobin-like flavoprotein
MSPEDKALVKTTWAMVIPIADVAATLFYDRLFALDSSLRPMFDRTDMKEQRRKLLAALGAAVNGLDNLEPLIPVLENLGRSHSRYGVNDVHYETVGAALLWTLEQGLGEAWTPATKAAWTQAYGTVANVMRSAAEPSAMPAVA